MSLSKLMLPALGLLTAWLMPSGSLSQAQAADPQAAAYFQQLFQANQQLRASGIQVGAHLSPVLEGKEADAAKLEQAMRQLQQTLAQSQANLEKATPPDSPEGKALATAHANFMRGQQSIIQTLFPQMVQQAVDRGKPIAQRQAELRKGFEEMGKTEQALMAPLFQAAKAYAAKYGIPFGREPQGSSAGAR